MKLKKLLNISYPIIQGGLARTARGPLAAAVSNAGGLGLVGTGGFTTEQFEEEIAIAKSLLAPGKSVGVNLVLTNLNLDEQIDVAIREGISIATISSGNPAPFMEKLLSHNMIVIPLVGSVRMAQKSESLGASAVVFEGMEAGGHVGNLGTMAALPQIVDAVSIPVIAAGGIAGGRQILAAQALGAEGVQMGTRFLVAEETQIHPDFKQAILDAKDTSTVLTGMSLGSPVRQLSNAMTEEYLRLEQSGASVEELEKVTVGSLGRAVFEGDRERGSMMAGQVVGMLNKIESVSEIFKGLRKEYEEARGKISGGESFFD